jgi:hypothetical protein
VEIVILMIKCLQCGKIFDLKGSEYNCYCSEYCYIVGITYIYREQPPTSLKPLRVKCNWMMVKHKLLCRLCIHRLKKVVSDNCIRRFERVRKT